MATVRRKGGSIVHEPAPIGWACQVCGVRHYPGNASDPGTRTYTLIRGKSGSKSPVFRLCLGCLCALVDSVDEEVNP